MVIPRHERRKDHWAMTAHHVITSLLVLSSYVFHYTSVGNVVLVVMDVADVVLCAGKCSKYLGKRFQRLCDAIFGVFIVTWIITRHIVYAFILWSIHKESRAVLGEGRGRWDPWFFREVLTVEDAQRPV